MFCTSCGSQTLSGDRYCRHCGSPLAPGVERPAPARLVRIRSQKKLGGVCAGFAEYMNLDVTLMRLLVVLLTILTGGVLLIAYIVAWIVMPEGEYPPVPVKPEPPPANGSTISETPYTT